jgi:hypothetical protein
MDISPQTTLLKSYRAERGDIVLLCGEAVDNSLDAAATSIEIELGSSEIVFRDNGIGIPLERFKSIFALGNHAAMTSTNLGRFGVGIKGQAINVADSMMVTSVSIDGRLSADVNWPAVSRSGVWDIDDPVRMPVMVGTPTGTTITLNDLRPLKPYTLERVSNDLAMLFYPALAEGKSIILNRTTVPLLADPPMTDIVQKTITLSGGRGAQIRGGILKSSSRLHHVHVAFGHRVIKPASTFGCGMHSGLFGMFARVQLTGRNWHLSTYKNELSDETERNELEEAVADALQPILEKCQVATLSARIVAISRLVNELLPDHLTTVRPYHLNEPQNRSGKKRKRTTPGIVDASKSDQASGPARAKRGDRNGDRDRLLISLEGSNAEQGIGSFHEGTSNTPNRVDLSADNPTIAEILESRDDKFIALALRGWGIALFEEGRSRLRTMTHPELDLLSFGERIARHLEAERGTLVRERSGKSG